MRSTLRSDNTDQMCALWEREIDGSWGISCFLRDGDDIFHTYSMYARGAETLGGSYYFLDICRELDVTDVFARRERR